MYMGILEQLLQSNHIYRYQYRYDGATVLYSHDGATVLYNQTHSVLCTVQYSSTVCCTEYYLYTVHIVCNSIHSITYCIIYGMIYTVPVQSTFWLCVSAGVGPPMYIQYAAAAVLLYSTESTYTRDTQQPVRNNYSACCPLILC